VTVLNLSVLPAGSTVDTSVAICAGQAYTLPSGKTVNTTGVYSDTLHYASTGCDSLVTVLNLSVLPAGSITDTSVTICAGKSYTLPSGKTVNATGVYSDTLRYTSTGCDSLVTMLNLTVLPAGSITDTSVTICAGQAYTLPSGKTVNTTGVYNDTLFYHSTGCDSLITVTNLTVLPAATMVNTSATICAGQAYTLPSGKKVNTTGVYNDTLRYTATGCDSLVTMLNLTVLPAGSITDTSVAICAGQAYTLPSGKTVNATGVYSDTLHYMSTGCDSLITVLNLTVLPTGSIIDTSVTICAGQAYTLPSGKTVNTTGVYNDTLRYTSTGCDSLVTVLNLTVGNTPVALSVLASQDSVCKGSPVDFEVVTASSGPFKWFVNNVESGSGKTFTTGKLTNGDSVYCVAGKASSCSVPDTSASVYITVVPLPTVAFNPDTIYITNNTPVQLTPIVSGTIANYLWTPADGLSSANNVARPYTNPTNNTVYRVGVVTTNGCSAEATVTVILRKPLVIPNAFTPNGDGHNDIFRLPVGAELILGEFDVFDRSGFRVFVTRDIGTGWDGNYNGVPQPPGTYVYMVKGTTPNGEPVLLKGTVVLVR
jgi:gliding motility-associated-like protein